MNNEHFAAQSDIKNPRELKPPGANASHDPVTTHNPSHSGTASPGVATSNGNPASPKKIFVCSPYRPLAVTE